MNPKSKQFCDLCQAVAAGDPNAVVRFRSNVLPYLRIIVRRAIRSEREASAVRARIRAAAQHLHAQNPPTSRRGTESCVGQLARRVCELLIRVMQSYRRALPRDTVLGLFDLRTLLAGSTPAPRPS